MSRFSSLMVIQWLMPVFINCLWCSLASQANIHFLGGTGGFCIHVFPNKHCDAFRIEEGKTDLFLSTTDLQWNAASNPLRTFACKEIRLNLL